MRGNLVCRLVDPKTFEVQVRTVAFHGVASAESRGIAL